MSEKELRFKPLTRNRFLVKNIYGIGIGMISPDSKGWVCVPVRHEIKRFDLFDDAVRHFNSEELSDLHEEEREEVVDYCY